MKYFNISIFLLLFLLFSCSSPVDEVDIIIPKPLNIKVEKGSFILNNQTKIYTNLEGDEKKNIIDYLRNSPLNIIEETTGDEQNTLRLLIVDSLESLTSPESYRLEILSSGIKIEAVSGVGIFYGLQSLSQLVVKYPKKELPNLTISDEPQFAYRGLMLDVSRHFYSPDFIKKQLNLMAYYKLNRFHWHLTDNEGWRIEIKKYPQLTEKAAWRTHEDITAWRKTSKHYSTKEDPEAYGGYYTQDDIREIVKYASERYITVIPEIELPGHSSEVLAVFPRLSCAGKPYVNADYCIGNEETFQFLEDVLLEVIDLFPSGYIHIGGDEATKSGWRTCPKCRKRMQQEGLKDVDELQSYMIHRIEDFVNEQGRHIIGWDEILEGGLAPNAVVMSWRGERGGIAAARSGHQVIMTPLSHLYLDSYQDAPPTQPEAMAGFLPLEKVYSYTPLTDSLNAEQQKLILGVQANLWTVLTRSYEHTEYMLYPRLLALAEVGWTREDLKSWTSFHNRALDAVTYLQSKGYHPLDLKNEVGPRLESEDTLKHLAWSRPVEYMTMYHPRYTAAAQATLTDGLRGGWSFGDDRWQGFVDSDMDVVIDLGEARQINSINATFIQDYLGWIWMPKEVSIFVANDDKNYTLLKTIENALSPEERGFFFCDFGWEGVSQARYIRYVAKSGGRPGGWIFTDEIIVK